MKKVIILSLFFIAILTGLPMVRAGETVIDNMDCSYGAVADDDGDTLSGGGCTTTTYHEFTDNFQTALFPLEVGSNRILSMVHDSAPNVYTWDTPEERIGISKPITLNLSRKHPVNITLDLDRATSGGVNSTYYQLCLVDDDGDFNCMDWRSMPTTWTHRTEYYSGFNMSSDPTFNNESIVGYTLMHRPQTLEGSADYRLDSYFDNITAHWTEWAGGGGGPGDPVVYIVDPEQGGLYEDESFNIPINWDSSQTCTQAYYNYNEEGNISFGGNITITQPYDNGERNITIYCQNSFGEWGANTSFFNISVPAVVVITRPENSTYTTTENITYQFDANQPTTFIYSIDEGANTTHPDHDITATGYHSYNNFSVASQGLHNITVWANNTLGMNYSFIRYFTVLWTGLIILPDYPNGTIFSDPENVFIGANFTFGVDVLGLFRYGMFYKSGDCVTNPWTLLIDDTNPAGGYLRKKFDVNLGGGDFCIQYFSHSSLEDTAGPLIFDYEYSVLPSTDYEACISLHIIDKWNNSLISDFIIFNSTTGFNQSYSGASGGWICGLNTSSTYMLEISSPGYRTEFLTNVIYPGNYEVTLHYATETGLIHVVVRDNTTNGYISQARVTLGDDKFYTGGDGIATFWRVARATYSGEVSAPGYASRHFSVFPQQGVNYEYVYLQPSNSTLGFNPPSSGSAWNTVKMVTFILFMLASLATGIYLWNKILPSGGS